MQIWTLVLLLAIISIAHSKEASLKEDKPFVHVCIHDSLKHEVIVVPQEYDEIKKDNALSLKRATSARFSQPIRILTDYSNLVGDSNMTCYFSGQAVTLNTGGSYKCTDADILGATQQTFLKTIVADAVSFWESTIAVMSSPALTLATGKLPYCGSISVNPSYASLPNYDFVLMVTTRPIPGSQTLATGTTCQTDPYGRPKLGWININPATLVSDDSLKEEQEIAVIIHEMCHALGFSNARFTHWIQWNDDTSLTNYTVLSDNQIKGQDANQNYYIITPKTRAAASAHFACNSTYVAALEPLGGAGTQWSHWAMKAFYNDFMTGVASTFPLYSQMTFAVLEDTGYYEVYNRSRIESLVWGRHRGCSFITDCTSWPTDTVSDPGYKCTPPGNQIIPTYECTADLRSEGQCSAGGGNPLLGSCTFVAPIDAKRCDNPYNTPLFNLDVGQQISRESRCFQANILKISSQIVGIPAGPNQPQCYKTTCEGPTQLKLQIDSVWYDCPYDGGEFSPIGYGGSVQCPPQAADRICLDAVEDTTWPKFISIDPVAGPPGTTVTITGNNFVSTSSMTVTIQTACTNVQVKSDTQLTCTLGPTSDFATLPNVAQAVVGMNVQLPVVVTDAQGRTDYQTNAFTVQIPAKDAVAAFITTYPGWFAGIIILVVVIIICIVVIIVKCCCKKKGDGY